MSGIISKTVLNLSLSVLTSLTFSCKKLTNSASTKTLDNFAAGQRVQVNHCAASPALRKTAGRNLMYGAVQGDFDDKTVSTETMKKLRDLGRNVATAIPEELQRRFIGFGGVVIITSRTKEICSKSVLEGLKGRKKELKEEEIKKLKEGLEHPEACYKFVSGTKSERQSLEIYLSPDPVSIEHGLVRTFGYALAEFFGRLRLTGDKPVSFAWNPIERQDFYVQKKAIARAFLSDIKGTPNEKNFSRFYPNGGAPIDEVDAFHDWTFAEAFDSYYCNNWSSEPGKNTLATMKSQFDKTRLAFESYINANTGGKGFGLEGSTEQAANSSLNLEGAASQPTSMDSPWWAGTKAFFGSISDNTVGRASQGYQAYSDAVGKKVEEVYTPDSSIAATAGKAVSGVISDASGYTQYREDVRKSVDKAFQENPGNAASAVVNGIKSTGVDYYGSYSKKVEEDINTRFETQTKAGVKNANEAAFNSFMGHANTYSGATQFYEAAAGHDTKTGDQLSAEQRAWRMSEGAFAAMGPASLGQGIIGGGIKTAAKQVEAKTATHVLDDLAKAGVAGETQSLKSGASTIRKAVNEVGEACMVDCGTAKAQFDAAKLEAAKQRVEAHNYVISETEQAWKKSPLQKISPFDSNRFQDSVVKNIVETDTYKTQKFARKASREQLDKALKTHGLADEYAVGYKIEKVFAADGAHPVTGKSLGGTQVGWSPSKELSIIPKSEFAAQRASKEIGLFAPIVDKKVLDAAQGLHRQ
jgi:hypothetical protein